MCKLPNNNNKNRHLNLPEGSKLQVCYFTHRFDFIGDNLFDGR